MAISTDGNYAIIGSYNDDDTASNSGSAYIYIRSGTSWTQQAKINASDAASNDFFGNSVAINADGTIVAVGARKEDSNKGAVYVFSRTGSSWSQTQKIVSTSAHAANAYFGKSVGLSDTGNRLVIGTDGGGNPSNSGYMEVLEGSPDTNLQNASYDNVYIDVRGTGYTNGVSGAGLSRAYSLEFNGDGTKLFVMNNDNYIYQFNLSTAFDISTASYPSPAVRFYVGPGGTATTNSTGISMQFKPDGTKLFIIDGHYGKLNEYALSTAYDITTMSHTAQFSLTSNGYAASTIRGFGVTYDGSKFFIGTANQNRLYAYSMSTAWDVSTASYSNQSFRLSDIGGSNSHAFASVRFNQAGTKMFFLHYAGQVRQIDLSIPNNLFSGTRSLTYSEDVTGQGTQSYDFAFNNDMSKFYVANAASNPTVHQYSTGAASTAYGSNQVLVASDAASGDYTGRDVTISGDGLYIATGSIEDDGGAGSGSGSAYIWYYGGSSYSQQAKITPSDAAGNDKFGTSVSIDQDGNTLIVGARAADEPNNDQGAAYIFTRSGTSWSQQAKLVSSATQNSAEFGASVSISDDGNIAVGIARRETNSGAGVGSAYVFSRTGSTWALSKKIFGSDAVGGYLGYEPHAMDIAGDGLTMIAGNHSASSTTGAAYVFTAPEGVTLSDTLTLEAGTNITLTTTPGTDTISIAAAASTDSATTQAMIDSSIGFQVDSAYVQARQSGGAITVQEEGSSLSTAATTLNFVGSNVTASGNGATKTITIGGGGGGGLDSASILSLVDSNHIQNRQLRDNVTIVLEVDSNLSSVDSAQVIHSFPKTQFRTVKYVAQLENDDSNGYHAEEILLTHNDNSVVMTSYAKITIDSDIGTFDASVDSNNVILTLSPSKINTHVKLKAITIPGADADTLVSVDSDLTSTDSAQVIHSFNKNVHRTMKYTAQLSTPDIPGSHLWTSTPTNTQAFQSSNAANNDYFGYSASIDRNYAVVGATGQDAAGSAAGAAYIFYKSGGTWSQQQFIQGPSLANTNFGADVAIGGTTEGERIAVGGHGYSTSTGIVRWYTRSGNTWSQVASVTGPSGSIHTNYGRFLAMSGDTTVVGAGKSDVGGTNRGRAYVYTGNGVAQANFTASDAQDHQEFASSVDIHGDLIVCGSPAKQEGGTERGAAYVFERSGTTWTQKAKLTPSDGATVGNSNKFGIAVACYQGSGTNTIVVGARDGSTPKRGAVYVFTGSGTSYTQQAKLTASDGADNDRFGSEDAAKPISIDKSTGTTLFISSTNRDDNSASNSGAVYVFNGSGSSWTQSYKLNAFTLGPGAEAYFGHAVRADEHGSLIVGATGEDNGGSFRGAAYVIDAASTPTVAGSHHSQEILLTHNGTNVAMTGYAKLLMDSDLGTFDGTIVGNDVKLTLSPTKVNTSVKLRALRSRI